MKLILALVLCLAPTLAIAKDVPLPRPSPIRMAALPSIAQTAVNPDPFKVNPQPQTTQPTVVVAPAPQSDIISYIWAALGAIITGLLGKIAFKPPALPSSTPVVDPSHPDIRDAIDRAVLKAIETGLPGQLVRTGLGAIPGVGGLAAQLEPVIRRVVTDVIEQRLGEAAPSPLVVPSGLPQDFLGRIEEMIQTAIQRKGG